jgi:hypothetical protein
MYRTEESASHNMAIAVSFKEMVVPSLFFSNLRHSSTVNPRFLPSMMG